MDACARIRGVPLRTRASRKELVRDDGTPCMKSLLSSRKELCSMGLELQTRDTPCLTEIHFVCLPGHSEGEDLTLQALSSLPGDLAELLRSLHVTSLRNEEVLLLKDSRRSADRRDSSTQQQCWLKAVCVLRPSPSQAIVGVLGGLLGRYTAGVRYALELQALHKGTAESCQPEDDNTNQSVSSIEDDFVTALEHLEEEDNSNGSYLHGNQRDVASQTVPAHKRNKDLSGSRIIISSAPRKSLTNRRSPPEVSITVQHSRGAESQWTLYSPRAQLPSPTRPVSESEESDGSSPSPIIFLDEVGYQKSLKATLDIPQIPGGPTDRVEDSDSEVSEFFDSFDQFDDLDELSSESCTLTLPLDPTSSISPTGLDQKKKYSEAGTGKSGSKKVSRSCSTMNPHRFDQRTLPANVKKPTPLRSPLPPGALKDFLMVKKQMFNSTVTQFAADLAEELVFEGMMEVCQFSHPSTPLTPSDWSFGVGEDDDEEVVSSYASDLSESVLQEAFIELSQADVAFSTQAAISVSVDNICYVSAVDTHTCSTAAGHQAFHVNPAEEGPGPSGEDGCTVKKALFCVSGMASCVPVPQAGQAISHLHDSEEICQCKTSPKRSCSSENRVVTTTSSDATAATQTDLLSKTRFHNFSGNMVDMIVSEACELMTATKMKKNVDDCADFLSKTIVGRGPPSGQEGSVTDQTSLYSLHPPFQTPGGVNFESGSKTSRAVAETLPVMMNTLDVPGLEMGGWGGRKMTTCEEMVPSPGHKSNRTPGTPPSTPQQPSEVSQEKQIKQFSKKLKEKLAKEFSTATPPPTPHYQPGPEPKESTSESDKADFMLKLMRSLSEEADGNEEEEEEGGVEGVNSVTETGSRMQPELNFLDGGHKMADKGALHYAERLACHIVSMATEIDTLGGVEDGGRRMVKGREERDSVAQFSAQTLNTLWIYAGEVAGEVISDVKRIMWSGQCRHSALTQGIQEQSGECPHHHQPQPSEHSRDCGVGRLAEQWSSDLLSSVLHPSTSTPSSGLSSDYPSCESVTDEYAGYLIRVLKKEGGSRELVLDQYASRLAYRSIKLGLAHAARNMKKRPSSSRHHSSRRLQQNGCRGLNAEPSVPRDEAGRVGSPSRDIDDGSQREYMELVNFAESLACNITCDVTRNLCVPSVRLPKSRTDSCLYKKSKLEDMADSLIRNSFSCPLLSKEGNSRQYHSTGSLYDGGYSSGVMEVLEHYARNIVDDTLEMGLASAGNPAQQGPYRHLHSERRAVGSALGETTCPYCQVRECLFCSRPNRQHLLGGGAGQRRRRRLEGDVGVCNLEIPEIHINLDRRAVFAEEMVTTAMEGAKRELSNTSLNADSGIGHDGYSFAESLTAEIMTSALSNTRQSTNLSFPGREATESSVSQQLSLSVGDDSLGSWSRLSFEDEHPDETSSFLHLSDSEGTEDKEIETKDESCGSVRVGQAQAYRHLLVVNSELREMTTDPQHMTFDPQLRSMLQWAAASMADLPMVQLSPSGSRGLQQLPAVVQRLKEREWKVGELLQALLRYCEETQTHTPPQSEPREAGRASHHTPLFQWLLEHA
ncbi:A-kinase anchor protein 11-like isoform 6-T6 [Salvelinus alpinus]